LKRLGNPWPVLNHGHEFAKSVPHEVLAEYTAFHGVSEMIRLVVIAVLVVLVWLAAMQVVRMLKSKNLDWNGIVFALGFVALAFYLRHVTGIG